MISLLDAAGVPDAETLSPMELYEATGKIHQDKQLTKLALKTKCCGAVLPESAREEVLREMSMKERHLFRCRVGL
jgi:hypothetical protein